ncbi:MAG: cobaltochelatase subunit CobN, partial [Sneathiella sp.]
MHLLAATPGGISDGSEAIELGQTPGDIVFLSAADTELSSLATSFEKLTDKTTSVRLANTMQLIHNLSVDIYVDDIIRSAKLVIIRLLGGVSYWPYGVEQITETCRKNGIKLAFLPGDDNPDEELSGLNTLGREESHRLWQYLVQGGAANYDEFLKYSAFLLDRKTDWREPRPLLKAGIYWPNLKDIDLDMIQTKWINGAPVVGIIFYRALFQANNLGPVNDLITALGHNGVNALPVYVSSLKDPISSEILEELFFKASPSVILNATGFAVSNPGGIRKKTPFDQADCPVLQIIFSGGNEENWRSGISGLSARDIAMNVALPEVDGRVLTRAVSFKADAGFDKDTQTNIVAYKSVQDRIDFVADLATNWARLRHTPTKLRKIGLILANYPTKNGRIGNGVGLDTPAGTIEVLKSMKVAGYEVEDIPDTGNALIEKLL